VEVGPEVTPGKPEVAPAKLEVAPAKPDVTPAKPEVEPAKPEVTPAKPEVEPVKPDVEPGNLEVAPGNPEVTPAKPEVEPANPRVEPVNLEVEPANPRVEPVNLEVGPVNPQGGPANPHVERASPHVVRNNLPGLAGDFPGERVRIPTAWPFRLVCSIHWAVLRLAVLGLLTGTLAACYAPLDVAPYVDTSQMTGTWFEIALLPRTTQTGCTNTTATYLPQAEDGHFSVTNQCTLAGGTVLTKNASLYVLDTTTNAKLGIDLGGFIGDYWILEVASDYHYLVVGHPSRDYLWILSRTKQLSADDTSHILARVQSQGFDTSNLVYTTQN
jgi:apolipoprotein D and lipocalin family protein